GFLADAAVCQLSRGTARRLVGPEAAAGAEVPLSPELNLARDDLEGHVVLLRKDRWLDLWPLCVYGRASGQTPEGLRPARADSPLTDLRMRPQGACYSALGSELPYAEWPEPLAEFREIFQLGGRQRPKGSEEPDFEEEVRREAAAFVGREAALQQAKEAIRQAGSGVLWLGGPPRRGQSALVARPARDLRGGP